MPPVIVCSGLVKRFGPVTALDGLDLEVETGEVHGFVGPNGAGKTVTTRIILGLLRRDEGEVTLFGADPWEDAVNLHRRLAYVPGDTNLWPTLTGGEIVDLLGELRGGLDPARRQRLIERFNLDPRKKARTYSKGNRQKVALVAALASDAELLVLDEPTSGLDPLMEAVFQDFILTTKAEGRTVLLSSHILAEVEKICDRVTIIRQGRTVQSGTLAEMRHLTRTTISAQTRQPPDGLASMPGVHDLRTEGGTVTFDVDTEHLDAVVQRLAALGVRSLTSQPPTLEELFLRHYGDEFENDESAARSDDESTPPPS
jgi:ABC-2 type transport system ATP-binding protein